MGARTRLGTASAVAWKLALVAVAVLGGAAIWLQTHPKFTVRGTARIEGYDWEIVDYSEVSRLTGRERTRVCLAPLVGDRDPSRYFLIVDEPWFIDYTMAFDGPGGIRYWLHPGRDKRLVSENGEVRLDELGRTIKTTRLPGPPKHLRTGAEP